MNKLLRKLTAVVSAAAVALTCVSFGGIAFAEDYTELCAFELTGTGYTIEKGYYYTNTKEIVKRAGISIGNFYNYFKDKKRLYKKYK